MLVALYTFSFLCERTKNGVTRSLRVGGGGGGGGLKETFGVFFFFSLRFLKRA
jgi:hypothetical protein